MPSPRGQTRHCLGGHPALHRRLYGLVQPLRTTIRDRSALPTQIRNGSRTYQWDIRDKALQDYYATQTHRFRARPVTPSPAATAGINFANEKYPSNSPNESTQLDMARSRPIPISCHQFCQHHMTPRSRPKGPLTTLYRRRLPQPVAQYIPIMLTESR